MKLGIIGGSGVYDPAMLSNIKDRVVSTVFGDVLAIVGDLEGREVAFIQRHGAGHVVAPHKINYRANIAALKVLGVERIVATAAVGSINEDMPPGSFVVPDQFIDNTWGRPVQFFEEGEWAVTHLDMTAPYCAETRKVIVGACEKNAVAYKDKGTYVCFQGPRYETPAEIRMFKKLGGDVAGMTHVPEIILAREAEICYAGICVVTNWAAGLSLNPLHHTEVAEIMREAGAVLKKLIADSISNMPLERTCGCGRALDEMVKWGRKRPDFETWHGKVES